MEALFSPRQGIVAGLALLLCAGMARGQMSPTGIVAEPPPAHPHRIIVKYRSSVTQCADCLLARGIPFATVTGTSSLDRLNRRLGIRSARPLFFDYHGTARGAAYRHHLATVRKLFPRRSARIPANAVLPDLSNVFVVDLGRGVDPAAAAALYAKDPDVEYAEPDYVMHATLVPDDPFLSSTGSFRANVPDLWGLLATQAEAAWDVSRGDGIVVAVIDTGVRYRHKDLRANMWVNPGEIAHNRKDDDGNGYADDVYGWDFVKNRANPNDRHGHGTHVAGIIAATGNNGMGVVGMAWGARIMAVRGLDAKGYGYTSNLAKAMMYAVENGADVLNNSWGSPFLSSDIQDAVDAATSMGAVVVFAAGNSNSPYAGTASARHAIAVAATEYGDTRASFSNYGSSISVAAPGVDILSLKGPRRVGGQVVEHQYRVLSGTSMAAPHVSGLAALLLSAMPNLTPDEVRWHMELNADQPGYPGYEGQAWNPYFGWGRINAARAFDAIPVTTRIQSDPIVLHGLAGTAMPDVASFDFLFTTSDPVDWTISNPSWLTPSTSSGTGPATVSLSLDATALSPATYTGSVDLSVPAATDGGGSLAATAYIHQDNRVGGPVTLNNGLGGRPRVGSDGQGIMAAWFQFLPTGGSQLVASYLDQSGNVTGPFVVASSVCVDSFCTVFDDGPTVTYGGGDFLIAWTEHIESVVFQTSEHRYNHSYVKAVRVTASGQVLDATPVEIASNTEKAASNNGYDQYFYDAGTAFDGTAYTMLWGLLDFGTRASKPVQVFLRRIGADGTLLSAVQTIYPVADTVNYQYIEPKIACVTGSCLVAWHEADGETDPVGHYIDKLYGRRFTGVSSIDSPPVRLLRDIEDIGQLISDGTGYFATGYRVTVLPGPVLGGYEIMGARITASNASLDPDGIRLDNGPPNGISYASSANSAAFDGSDYIVTWEEFSPTPGSSTFYPFAAHLAQDGTVVGGEPDGSLLSPGATMYYAEPQLASGAGKSYMVYPEAGSNPPLIVAQGIFPH